MRTRTRMLMELGFGGAAGILGVLTLVWKDWIEAVFGVDPDNRDSLLEWVVVLVCLALAVLFGSLAHRDWRRLPVGAPSWARPRGPSAP